MQNYYHSYIQIFPVIPVASRVVFLLAQGLIQKD